LLGNQRKQFKEVKLYATVFSHRGIFINMSNQNIHVGQLRVVANSKQKQIFIVSQVTDNKEAHSKDTDRIISLINLATGKEEYTYAHWFLEISTALE
jgi:hypothetical protein